VRPCQMRRGLCAGRGQAVIAPGGA
jgi:hypothetical protein